jgi:hypothetical protein
MAHDDLRWVSYPGILDVQSALDACALSPPAEVEPDKDFHFVLKGGKPAYTKGTPCNWEGVTATVTGVEHLPLENFQLHVWGAGVYGSINVGPNPAGGVFLSPEPEDTQDLYLARLWATRNVQPPSASPQPGATLPEPVSEIIHIPTYANSGKQCQRNQITLNFVPKPR